MTTIRHGLHPMPGREVWAHSTHHGQADFQTTGIPVYDSEAPLLLRKGEWNSAPIGDRMAEVTRAGIDGLQVLVYPWEPGDNFLREFLPEAEKAGVKIAPCYFTDDASVLAGQAAQWIATAGSSLAAGRIEGKLMVWLYCPSQKLDVQAFLSDPRVAGKVVLLGDMATGASQTGLVLDKASKTHATRYRAAWVFEDSMGAGSPAVEQQVVDWCRKAYVPFIGGVMPSYNRENPANGGFVDARGTRNYRERWSFHLSKDWIRWVSLVTWQDFSEGHTIRPSTQWTTTRSAITKWCSDQLKGIAHPSVATLFVTSPVQVNQSVPVATEALVLNGTSSSASVVIELVNQSGAVVHRETGTVPAGAMADVTTRDKGFAPGWVRPKVTMTCASKTTVMVGSPVLVHPSGFVPTTPYRRRYFSVDKTSSSTASLSVSGGVARLRASGAVRFVEVLQNGRVAGRSYTSSLDAVVPMKAYSGVGGQDYNAASTGWVVGRVIGTDGSVTYTNPVRLG